MHNQSIYKNRPLSITRYYVVSIDILLMIIDGFVSKDIITTTGGCLEQQMDGLDVEEARRSEKEISAV